MMEERIRATFVKVSQYWLVGLAGLLLVSLPNSVSSQIANTFPVESLRVTAELTANGQVNITQKITHLSPAKLDWQIFTDVKGLAVTADGQPVSRRSLSLDRVDAGLNLTSSNQTARQWQLDYQTSTTLIRTSGQDRLFLKILQEPGRSVGQIDIDFRLPSTDATGLFGNVYAIHGVTNPRTEVIPPNRIVYQVDFAGPRSFLTVNANWPKTVLQLGLLEEIRLSLFNLEIIPWLWLGLALPFTSLVVLLRLLIKQRHSEVRVATQSDVPPSDLSPVLVGVLVNKKVNPEEIVSLFVDLCQRGYLVIVQKKGHYFLGQRRVFDEQLEEWERAILDVIFPSTNVRVSTENMRALSKESLYSPEFREAFSRIYEVITEKNYFSENPHMTRVKYKLVALIFYFASSAGLIWTAVTGASPYLLIPLTGSLLMSFLIIKLTPKLIRYTREGLEARQAWLSFANYLSDKQPIMIRDSLNLTFERYLPYAIALHRTAGWARRFDVGKTVMVQPDWLISFEQDSAAEYTREISKFVRSLSELIASMRGPLVT